MTALLAANAFCDASPDSSSLLGGYNMMYDLKFDGAHQFFQDWSQAHPDDAMGPVSDAAGYLFSEFNRLGVLEAQFFENDKQFAARQKLTPDPALRDRFTAAISQAETRARAKLAQDGKDRDALLAMTLASGLKADYAALIEKSNLTSLHFTKEAETWGAQVLAVDPGCYDAHLASGVAKYIIGSMAAPVRWLVRLGGVSGDKEEGMQELQVTADKGKFLGPFARILLSIAYVREKEKPRAVQLLTALRSEYPNNHLFDRELQRLGTAN